jgi:hypothetical protein
VPAEPVRSRSSLTALLYFVAASVAVESFLVHWEGGMRFELEGVLSFAVPRPYVYRVLMPLVVRAAARALPPPVARAAVDAWGHGVAGLARSRGLTEGPPAIEFLVATWLMLGALWGAALVWRRLIQTQLGERSPIADVMPALLLLALPLTFTGGGFLYDFPELFFVSALFLALVQRRWALWYALLPVAILNKEATSLVVVWLFALLPSMGARRTFRHLLASALVAAATVGGLWWHFRAIAGFFAQPNIAHNLRYWASLRWLFATQDAFGTAIPLPVSLNAINLYVLWLVWSRGKGRTRPEIARAFVLSCAAVAPLVLAFGFENEIRTCAIVAPPLVLLASAAVGALYERPVESR